MQAMTVCKDCGKEFVYTYTCKKHTYCDECVRKRAAESKARSRAEPKLKPIRRKRSVTNERIIAAANRASKLGLTYGVYMGKE